MRSIWTELINAAVTHPFPLPSDFYPIYDHTEAVQDEQDSSYYVHCLFIAFFLLCSRNRQAQPITVYNLTILVPDFISNIIRLSSFE